jgi:hypothetical protein
MNLDCSPLDLFHINVHSRSGAFIPPFLHIRYLEAVVDYEVGIVKLMVLGAGLEPACLSAYAPQTYVSAIPPPERLLEDRRW